MNLLRRVRGSGTLYYRGLAIQIKDAIAVEPQLDPFDVESDAYGAIDRRKNNSYLQVRFTPVGVVSQDALDVLLPFRSFRPGQFNTPVFNLDPSGISGDTLTLAAGHGVRVGDTLVFGDAAGSGDTPLTVTTVNGNAVTVSAAIPAMTRPRAQLQSEFVMWTHDGVKLRVHNAAVSQMPELTLSAGATFWGQVTVEGYRRADTETPPAGENLLYTVTDEPHPGEMPVDPADIPTVPYLINYQPPGGNPVACELRDPLKVSFDVKSNDVSADRVGLIARAIASISATAKLVPVNQDAFDLLDLVTAQNQARGTSLPAGTLDISGPGGSPWLRLYGAQLTAVPLSITTGNDRVGEITFQTRRVIGSPVFYAGMGQPQ